MVTGFPSDRRSALQRLAEFVENGAPDYARTRNFVRSGHGHVSRLSAALRHRLISEEEVASAVLAAHRFPPVEKFIQEVVWRTYWKGWLEQHPGVWEDYVRQAAQPLPAAAAELLAAGGSAGSMGCFTEELSTTGYLHNHARMWWAAWWCHQHRLPWAAGARFFADYLLDADAASNTLGWRWVAGLQTPGKVYLARRENVAKYWPEGGTPEGIDDQATAAIPPETADRTRVDLPEYPEAPAAVAGKVALLGHAEDLSVEITPLGALRPAAVATVAPDAGTDGEAKRVWRAQALDDAASRWSAHYAAEVDRLAAWEDVPAWLARAGCRTLVLMAPMVGPEADSWQPVRRELREAGVEIHECRRAWDSRFFPAARAGFFPFWNKTRGTLMKRLPLSSAPR